MSTCDQDYQKPAVGFSERVVTSVVNQANNLAETFSHARDVFVRMRRLRATEQALDSLPDNIRCDIGWPDFYERQVTECNEMKRRPH